MEKNFSNAPFYSFRGQHVASLNSFENWLFLTFFDKIQIRWRRKCMNHYTHPIVWLLSMFTKKWRGTKDLEELATHHTPYENYQSRRMSNPMVSLWGVINFTIVPDYHDSHLWKPTQYDNPKKSLKNRPKFCFFKWLIILRFYVSTFSHVSFRIHIIWSVQKSSNLKSL